MRGCTGLRVDPGASCEVVYGRGGTVHALSLVPAGKEGNDLESLQVLVSDSLAEMNSNPWFRGRILFPFNDRIAGGKYTLGGREYSLEINDPEQGDAIHGFLYRHPMEVVSRFFSPGSNRLTLAAKIPAAAGYPFTPGIEIRYVLEASSLHMDFTVQNSTREPLPFSLGWHPYFYLPTVDGTVDSLVLRVEADRYVRVDERLIPTGEMVPVEGSMYDYREGKPVGSADLDTAFKMDRGITCLSNGEYTLTIQQSRDLFGYLQVFTHPDRGSMAIEPVSAAANAFNMPSLGLRILQPGEQLTGRVSVTLYAGQFPNKSKEVQQ